MRHQNRRSWMLVMGQKLLHNHHTRLKLVQHFYYTIVQVVKTLGHVSCLAALGTADDAGLTDVGRAATVLEDAVAGHLQAGIKPQDARVHAASMNILGWIHKSDPPFSRDAQRSAI